MVTASVSTAITRNILSFQDLETKLNLKRSLEANFFREWQEDLAPLDATETETIDRLGNRYLRYLEMGEISEGTVNIILLHPLLETLGLCDPPYHIRGETWVEVETQIETPEGKIVLEGRIDALTLLQNFWLVVIEGKRGGFNVFQGIPQTLAYMMANPEPHKPLFGLVTNGYDYVFVKLAQAPQNDRFEFGLSHNFTVLSHPEKNLIKVGQILKHLTSKVSHV